MTPVVGGIDESVGFAVRLYIHYVYSHTTNLYES